MASQLVVRVEEESGEEEELEVEMVLLQKKWVSFLGLYR